jgi:hypothetical protein
LLFIWAILRLFRVILRLFEMYLRLLWVIMQRFCFC